MAGARSVLLLFAAAWVDVFRGGEAVVTGSNWREHAAATSGGECRGARTRFDVDSEKVCVIELDARLSADSRLAGPVRCFGGFPFDMPPELVGVAFTDVSMGRHHVCALRAASEVDGRQAACWGTVAEPDKFGISSGAPKVSLQNLCSGSYYACGIMARGQGRDDEGQIVCWGESETVRAIAQEAAGRRLQELACGMYAVCAVLENSGLAECWGDDALNAALQQLDEPERLRLRALSVGMDHACALRDGASNEAGVGVCWGSNWMNADLAEHYGFDDIRIVSHSYIGKAVAHAGQLVDISAGADHTCAVTASGHLHCWGARTGVGETGVPPGNHWLGVRAGHMRNCAFSAIGKGSLACWGHYGRDVLEAVNNASVPLCPLAAAAHSGGVTTPSTKLLAAKRARVSLYGPDLSSLQSLDGSWLHVFPGDLDLQRHPFITILSPDAHQVVAIRKGSGDSTISHPAGTPQESDSGAYELPVLVLLSRMDAWVGGDTEEEGRVGVAEITIRVNGDIVPFRSWNRHSKGQWDEGGDEKECVKKLEAKRGETLVHLAVDVAALPAGMHVLEASLRVYEGTPAAGHTVSFWLAKHSALQAEEAEITDSNPAVHVIAFQVREVPERTALVWAHDMSVWLVLRNFQVGIDGSVNVVDSDASLIMSFPRLIQQGSDGGDADDSKQAFWRRLWPIATARCRHGTCTLRRDLSTSTSFGLTPTPTMRPVRVGDTMPWAGNDVSEELVVYEMGLSIPEKSTEACHSMRMTVWLEGLGGVPIEDPAAMSQWDVHMHCGKWQLPSGWLPDHPDSARAPVNVQHLVNKHWHQIPWMHHRDKLSRLNTHGVASCYWYSGPLADTPEWQRVSWDHLAPTQEDGLGHEEDGLCGFSSLLMPGVMGGVATQAIPDVVGFYHVSTVGDRWIKTVRRQLSLLRFSPIHNVVRKVVVGTSGHFSDVVPSLAHMLEQNKTIAESQRWGDHNKFEFVDHNTKKLYRDLGGSHVAREVPTLQLMFEHCVQDEHAHHWVFYLHSKGVGHVWPKFKWTQDWTKYMETMLYEMPHLCLHALRHGSAACGVELYQVPFLHYAGNFWWTTCARVRQLQQPDLMLPMTSQTWGMPENWIGTGRGGEMMSLMSAYDTNPYGTDLPRNAYVQIASSLVANNLCPTCSGPSAQG